MQCSSQVFEGRAFPTAAAKSQSHKLMLLHQFLNHFSFSSLAQHRYLFRSTVCLADCCKSIQWRNSGSSVNLLCTAKPAPRKVNSAASSPGPSRGAPSRVLGKKKCTEELVPVPVNSISSGATVPRRGFRVSREC